MQYIYIYRKAVLKHNAAITMLHIGHGLLMPVYFFFCTKHTSAFIKPMKPLELFTLPHDTFCPMVWGDLAGLGCFFCVDTYTRDCFHMQRVIINSQMFLQLLLCCFTACKPLCILPP